MESPTAPAPQRRPGIAAVRLNHAVLFVSDLDRAVRFYQAAFGMEVIAREERIPGAFLRLPRSGNHHDLGLFGIGSGYGPEQPGVGLYHLAWQVDTIDELDAARVTLAELGALVGMSSHGATKSLYGADPDGNEFEVQWMLPRAEWGAYENAAPIDRLDLRAERSSAARSSAPAAPTPMMTTSVFSVVMAHVLRAGASHALAG